MSELYRVVANFGATVAVLDESRQVHQAVPLTKLPQLVAGDRVECEPDSSESSLRVVKLIERDGVLSKIDHRHQPKPMAANVSHLAIVSAAPPGIDSLLIDQFCIAAEVAKINAVIIINKADLLNEDQLVRCEAMLEVYRSIGYSAVLVDTKGEGMLEPLIDELAEKTVVLVGASGVGKSSIVQCLLPDLDVRVGAISEATGFGAHTTSVTFWYELGNGGSIIDSPGVRQFSVSHLSVEDVRGGYREMVEAGQMCKFSNCSHFVEPDCAVKDAIRAGTISRWRYRNYKKLAEL